MKKRSFALFLAVVLAVSLLGRYEDYCHRSGGQYSYFRETGRESGYMFLWNILCDDRFRITG